MIVRVDILTGYGISRGIIRVGGDGGSIILVCDISRFIFLVCALERGCKQSWLLTIM